MKIKIKKRRILEVTMAILLCIGAFFLSREGARIVNGLGEEADASKVIVLDPGHGGYDPGKVGVNDALEKDINLSVALKLKPLLESEGYTVILTRDKDIALNDKGARNKKVSDMKNRLDIIESNKPLATISIHQNSYHQEGVKGAQVFYYKNSKGSKRLAETIQAQMEKTLHPDTSRKAKANESYFMLKKTSCPSVVVESGFLSNKQEAALLDDEDYQEKIAWAIHLGIMQYLNK